MQSSDHLCEPGKSTSSVQARAIAAAAAEVTLEAVEELAAEGSCDGRTLQDSDVRASVVGAAVATAPMLATQEVAGCEAAEEDNDRDIWDLLYRPARSRDDDGRASMAGLLGCGWHSQ